MKTLKLVVTGLVLVVLSSVQVIAVDSDPSGFANAVFGCSNLYAQPGETVFFTTSITNTYYSEPDAYLVHLNTGGAYYPGSPQLTIIDPTEPFSLYPGQSVEYTTSSVTIPIDTPASTSYIYCSDISVLLLKDSDTMIWNTVANTWERMNSIPTWADYRIRLYTPYNITVVPEPSSILALLCGIGGMGGVVWKKRLT